MKKYILGLLAFVTIAVAGAPTRYQDVIVEKTLGLGGTAAVNSKSLLDIRSTTKGVLLPRMTSTQRDAITSPPTGLLIFNTTTGLYNTYTGGMWTTVGGAAAWGSITGTLSDQTDLQSALNLKANLASPALTGNPTAPTQSPGNNSTRLATTAYVDAGLATVTPSWGSITGTLSNQTDLQSALNGKQSLDSTLTSLAAYNTNGLLTQTAADTFTGRTLTGTTDTISVSNGSGVLGNPTVTIANNPVLPGTGSVTVPIGTTAQQPGSPVNGMLRYNTDSTAFEGYAANAWGSIGGANSSDTNYVKNPSAKANANDVTTSSATVTRDTTSGYKIDGYASFSCNTSANGGYCEWDLNTIQNPDDSGNCEWSGQIKGDGTLYSAQLLDGSANVLNSIALGNVTDWAGFQVTYPCGAARKGRITQTTAGTSPALNSGRMYYGRLKGLGNATIETDWVPYTITVSGSTSGFGKGTIVRDLAFWRRHGDSIEIKWEYEQSATGASGSGQVLYSLPNALSFDTNKMLIDTTPQAIIGSGLLGNSGNLTSTATRPLAAFAYDSTHFSFISGASSSNNLQENNFVDSSAVLPLLNTYSSLVLSMRHIVAPIAGWTSSNVAFQSNMTGVSWSGYHDNTCFWNRSSTALGDPTADASCNLVETQNTGFGTVTTSGSVLPSITFTPDKIRKYFVCTNAGLDNGTLGSYMGARLTDGTTVIAGGEVATPTTGGVGVTGNVPLCGIYQATSLSPVTLKIQTSANSGTVGLGNAISTNSRSSLEWSIFSIDQQFPAPIIVNSVTSGTPGAERIERVKLNLSGASTVSITSQSGSWVTSATASSSVVTVNYASTTWTAAPTCTIVCDGTSGNVFGIYGAGTAPTTTSFRPVCLTSAGSATLSPAIDIICMGPR